MRPRRAVRADRRRPPLRREHRGASRPLERVRPREDRPGGNGSRQPLRVPPGLSGKRARPRLRLRALESAPDRRKLAHGLRTRGDRSGPSRAAVAAVLVLLRLQPVQQPPRGRLGDDPARLRGRRCRARRCRKQPVRVGYSSHEGAESAGWGDDKLEIVDGTHPVVYPADGSHANKFEEALYLGSSAEAGVGCDDTEGPHRELRPVVKTIPSDPAAAAQAFPWITLRGPVG